MLNWLVRYAPVAADVEIARTSVLDLGSGSVGLSTVSPGARFAGQDLAFERPVADGMFAVRPDPGRFPWRDGAFDTIVCLDVLEHVPPAQRLSFVQECARVAARRVLLACPTDVGSDTDEFFVQMYRSTGNDPPQWLDEHVELGLPSLADIEAACEVPGFRRRRWPQVNGLLQTLVVIGDVHPFFADDAAVEYRDRKDQWMAALQASRFGEGIRQGVELERIEARAPIVDPERFDETVVQALECPACHGELRRDGPTSLVCTGCARTATTEASGAFDLRA